MKAPPFDLVAPTSIEDAVLALAAGADRPGGVAVLAGGQSLLLDLHHRRVRPGLVVDLRRVPGLGAVDVHGSGVRIGALVRHRAFEDPALVPGAVGRVLPVMAEHVGHPPIRELGTFCGSLAWAHPTAEWALLAVTLGAQVTLRSAAGTRTVAAAEFSTGPHATVRGDAELLTAVDLPLPPPGAGAGFVEHRRTEASFAAAAALVVLEVGDVSVRACRIGLAGAADRPVRATRAEAVLTGAPVTAESFAAAARVAAHEDADPRAEPHGPVDHRRQVLSVLVRRALVAALDDTARAGGEEAA
ncbi:molybdopterin dehydrogenase [Kineococcus sp. R8]|uniref:FAD binding domain-containing protein n=1 Tax=Kineococcus siccus TaxID=2696567 RepID=UPI0014127EDE|nr:molybdopterin dehydrogenase [Kineococcus siccus]